MTVRIWSDRELAQAHAWVGTLIRYPHVVRVALSASLASPERHATAPLDTPSTPSKTALLS